MAFLMRVNCSRGELEICDVAGDDAIVDRGRDARDGWGDRLVERGGRAPRRVRAERGDGDVLKHYVAKVPVGPAVLLDDEECLVHVGLANVESVGGRGTGAGVGSGRRPRAARSNVPVKEVKRRQPRTTQFCRLNRRLTC